MTRTSRMIGLSVALSFVSGIALAQMNDLVAHPVPPDREVAAAQASLADALAHLKKVRAPGSDRNLRVLDLVQHAQRELTYEPGSR